MTSALERVNVDISKMLKWQTKFFTASASVITFILKAIVYEEWRAFGMMRKITVMKEILYWNVCQVTVTENIVVFLQSCSSINIFTDSLFFLSVYSHPLAFVFIELFPNFSMRFTYSNDLLQSRITTYSRWFCFSFWTTQVCWKVSNF